MPRNVVKLPVLKVAAESRRRALCCVAFRGHVMSKFPLKRVMLGAVVASAFTIESSGAFAACDTATITGNCQDLVLPNTAGNVNYSIDSGAVITSSNTDPNGDLPSVNINSSIGTFTNNGTVTGGGANAAVVAAGSAVINGNFANNGIIYSEDNEALLFYSGSTLNGDFINNGRIEAFSDDSGTDRWVYAIIFQNNSTINGTFTNSAAGVITSNSNHAVEVDTFISEFNNEGLISHTASDDNNWGPAVALFTGHIGVFNNSGTMTDSSTPLYGYPSGALLLANAWANPNGSVINTLINSGEMSVTNSTYAQSAITVRTDSSIGTINNLGDIWTAGSGYYGIENRGTITTLNNHQGTTGSYGSPLTYGENLPANYNMIVYGDDYGQLAVDYNNYSGSMTFGVFGGDAANGIAASQLNARVYENVVTGVDQAAYDNAFNTSQAITDIYGSNGAAFGSYNGVAWMLTDATYREGADTAWDLTAFSFGLDLAEPQRAMLEDRQQAVRNGLDYDCAQFDKDGICVSLKARYSGFGEEHEGAGVLTVAKQLEAGVRIGGFLDARLSSNEVDGVQMKSGLPMFGLFAAYSAHQDGTGLHARFAAAYEHGTADISRSNMLGSAATVSGTAHVDSYGIAQRFGWGFDVGNKTVLTPYFSLRLTDSTRGAYDEAYSAGVVEDPFSYDAYGQKRTTGTLGADFEGAIDQSTTYRLGAGLDYDVASNLDPFAAYSDLIGDMTYSNDVKARATRFFGSAGIGHMLEKNKTLTLDAHVSQKDFGSESAYSLMAGYQMAF